MIAPFYIILTKQNVVPDALTRKLMGSLAHVSMRKRSLVREMHNLGDMGVHFEVMDLDVLLSHF